MPALQISPVLFHKSAWWATFTASRDSAAKGWLPILLAGKLSSATLCRQLSCCSVILLNLILRLAGRSEADVPTQATIVKCSRCYQEAWILNGRCCQR